jgi:subtilisin family serine protease
VVVLKDSVADPAAASAEQAGRYQARRTAVFTHAIKGYAAELTPSEAAAVAADPAVQFVTQDRIFRLAAAPTSAPLRCENVLGGPQCFPDWADRIDLERSSTRAGDGRGSVNVNVAIIDTGIAGNHPDLNVMGGADCHTGTLVVPGTSLTDTIPHGTLVAGIAGAKDNQVGVVGAAPGTPLWSVKVVDPQGGSTLSAVLCGIDWVTSTRQDSSRSNDIAVANMSFELDFAGDDRCGLTNNDPFHLAICKSVAAGVTYVGSAGNQAIDFAARIPASYDEVLTVTAMADFDGKPGGKAPPECDLEQFGIVDDAAATFSNYAVAFRDKLHTIAAPGACMETTFPPELGLGEYALAVAGTSLAAPAVAGTVALCIADGNCRSGHPIRNIVTVLADTARYNLSHRNYGYQGDPLRPFPGRYYGFLVTATAY